MERERDEQEKEMGRDEIGKVGEFKSGQRSMRKHASIVGGMHHVPKINAPFERNINFILFFSKKLTN
jgi:hypothetical protein